MNPNLVISDKAISRDFSVGNIVKTEDRDLYNAYENLSDAAYFDTGLLPVDGSGILSIRSAGDRTQFVFQHAPGIYYMIWGKGEGDKTAAEINVAQPYRIVIGDHVDGELRGARHFYSPVPITSVDQPLYHCNVPNLNCKGYSGTSVGWICIYRTESYKGLPLGTKIFKTIERASGHEAYNDANMSGTDGARFYQAAYKAKPELAYLWDPKKWQQKTEAEGHQWALNPDLWLPIRVAGIDSQDAHDAGGVPLTLEMAMLGNYKAYYPHSAKGEDQLSLMNQIRRNDKKNPTSKDVFSIFSSVFAKTKKKEEEKQLIKQTPIPGVSGNLLTDGVHEDNQTIWKPQVPIFKTTGAVNTPPPVQVWDPNIGNCVHCTVVINELMEYYHDSKDNLICKECYDTHYGKTTCCKQIILLGQQFYSPDKDAFYCHSCHVQSVCNNCGTEYIDASHMVFDNYCEGCSAPNFCDSCGTKHSEYEVKSVLAKELAPTGIDNVSVFTTKTYTLCINCFQNSVICACGFLKPEDTCNKMPGTNQIVCQSCVTFNDNQPVFVSIHGIK